MKGYSYFLLKFFQFLPEADQHSLRVFSDTLKNSRSAGMHLFQLYSALRKKNLHRYLTIHAFQRLAKRISCDTSLISTSTEEQASDMIVQLITDYGPLGFIPGLSEYSSLVRSLAREPGKELEVIQLLDDVVKISNINPFVKQLGKGEDMQRLPVADRIPSEEEIQRIEESLIREERGISTGTEFSEKGQDIRTERMKDSIIEDEIEHEMDILNVGKQYHAESNLELDRIQRLVVEKRRQRLASKRQSSENKVDISRYLFHMAMRGFGQIYHVRGVMEVLNKMLNLATQVPFRIACHLIPNEETWNIVSDVLLRQRDRPTFVKTWIGFLSRGARPPVGLTRLLIQTLVRQSFVEQAVWVMRISRSLPDVGKVLPKTPHAETHIPWDLKVQIMYVASALSAATSYDMTLMTYSDAMTQGKAAAQLPLLSPPDLEMYAYLIGGAVRVDNERIAKHLFQELVDAGISPSGATYGHLARLYAQKGDTKRVFLIVRSILLRKHQFIAQERLLQGTLSAPSKQAQYKRYVLQQSSLLKADVHCLAPLLMLYLQQGSEDETLALLRSWNITYGKYVSAEQFGLALLKVYNQPEDTIRVNKLLQRVLDHIPSNDRDRDTADTGSDADTVIPSSGSATLRMQAFTDTIKTHLQARNLLGVVGVLRMMAEENLQPSYYILEIVMHGFLKEQALDLFDAMHAYFRDRLGMPLSLTLYSSWMRTLRNHGDIPGVQAAFDELVELGQIPNHQHYLYLVQAYAYGGWVERAVSIVYNMRKPKSSVRPGLNLNIAVIEAYVACGKLENAESELRYLLETSPIPQNHIPARPFNYMIIGHLFEGSGRKAMHMYEEIIRLGIKPDVYTFAILMHSYTLAGDLKSCMRVFNEMIRMGIEPDLVVYTILICAFGTKQKVENAEAVFEQISREQEWAQSQHSEHAGRLSAQEIGNSSSDALDLYAENPQRKDLPEIIDAFEIGNSDMSERLRINSFYNLNPVVYIAMLKVYRRAGKPLRALATWDRLIRNYPVVQWNPRKGGMLSKSMRYTGQFHLIAWTILLRTIRPTTGFHRVVKKLWVMSDYLISPTYPAAMRVSLDKRRLQKDLMFSMFEQSPIAPEVAELSNRMNIRSEMVKSLETELDMHLSTNRKFYVHKREQSATPTAGKQTSFSDFEYWMPQELDKPAFYAALGQLPQKRSASADHIEGSSPEFLKDDGEFDSATAKGIAVYIVGQWRKLEKDGFKFNNIHVSEYIPCILLGQQYDEAIRFLSLVKPLSEPSLENYRYYNLKITRRVSQLLVRLIRIVRHRLLGEKERRILLEILVDQDGPRYQDFVSQCPSRHLRMERSSDEIQVMHERLAVHIEQENGWFHDLSKLVEIATMWQKLVSTEEEMQYIFKAKQLAETALLCE
ncbi:hypothetical protein IW140_005445 [Coemansia sp. RSA 1813]|nr:hypothetical protein LPJ74_004541 [Coemansia sp. RSA 1843]KAJ2086914.1 hypothetical protein IW138_005329 [Coemansia sp. RSA 986]KAJ2565187.1 hypothetical protein IW140_005445 [Coemansia sp. RSA 1813]